MSRYNKEEVSAHYGARYVSGGYNAREFRLYEKYFRLLQQRTGELLKDRKRLIDLGCGSGIKTAAFAQFFQHTDGVDLSANAIEKAKSLVDDPKIVFYCADVFELGLEKADVVSAIGFSYFNEDDADLLANRIDELFGALGKAGSVMIVNSFTDFSGTAPSGWVMHSKEQLATLERNLAKAGYRTTLYFPQYDRANYAKFGFANALKEVVKYLKSRRRIFFVVIEKQS